MVRFLNIKLEGEGDKHARNMLSSLTSTNQATCSSVWGLMQYKIKAGEDGKKEEGGDGSRRWRRSQEEKVGGRGCG